MTEYDKLNASIRALIEAMTLQNDSLKKLTEVVRRLERVNRPKLVSND